MPHPSPQPDLPLLNVPVPFYFPSPFILPKTRQARKARQKPADMPLFEGPE
jgi:hypothetical protein